MPYDLSVPNPGPIPFPEEIDLAKVHRIHVLGVAGTGMGSFAGLLKKAGYDVTGSDENIYPPMSEKLPDWGIRVMPGFKPENLDAANPDLVIVGNVIRKVNPEATAMRERGLRQASFPAALGKLFLETRRPVVVAGTHGKTTTTALLAHVLASAGRDPSFLVGGVPKNFPESFHLGSGAEFVLEGDEYDTAYFDKGPKFLHYRPRFVQFNGAEFDHADIYRDMAHYESAFTRLFALVPADGFIAACASFHNTPALVRETAATVETYSARETADVTAANVHMSPEGSRFIVNRKGTKVGSFFLPMHGLHNIENATGATAIALGVTVWSGINTINSPGVNAVRADCVGQGASCPAYVEGRNEQLRTNVLIGVTAGLGAATGVIGLFFTRWSHAPEKAPTPIGGSFTPLPGGGAVGLSGRF